jgi:hypothetical protein
VCADASCSQLLTGVQSISASSDYTCALKTNGEVHCWGGNWMGKLGRRDPAPPDPGVLQYSTFASPVQFPGTVPRVATAIAAGSQAACALTNCGVYCWGYGFYSPLNGYTSDFGQGPTQGMLLGADPNQDFEWATPLRVTWPGSPSCQ